MVLMSGLTFSLPRQILRGATKTNEKLLWILTKDVEVYMWMLMIHKHLFLKSLEVILTVMETFELI